MKQDARERPCMALGRRWLGRKCRAKEWRVEHSGGGKVRRGTVPEELRESVIEHLLCAYCQLVVKNKNIFSCVTPSTGL